ncbi:Heterotrimeric G-protein alpha subunit [Mycena sanguinolenta]|uniref:Heterotrimeric G-protein alpha subunit n=1 Tax=Mycena sanguinolenta TaxID=230812 RepID=A0A8H6YTL2_9AGAR|nr:Heterotrimeric G-protein alpha subunit [Mycena sanguinolenta]
MGACASQPDRDSKSRSDDIDRQLEEDSKKYRKECKILLLGSGKSFVDALQSNTEAGIFVGESGKSTIVKQMKIIHQSGFTEEERLAYRKTIHKNVLDSAQALVEAIQNCGMEDLLRDKLVCETILPATNASSQGRPTPAGKEGQGGEGQDIMSHELADAIGVLWRDPVVAKVLDEHQSEFYLMDSAAYFLTALPRLAHPEYIPTEDDVLRARAQSTAITETRFNMGGLSIHMFDVGGQRSERKKWIHCFESVTSIIFCTALSEYDQVLLEERGQNRMRESLVLFESVINSRWFLRTSIILFLNKIDVFRVKLAKIPLERYFPEYTGGPDINKAAKYVLWRFMQENRARLSVYPHLTQATDTKNIRLVFAAVKETILQNALKDSGIL